MHTRFNTHPPLLGATLRAFVLLTIILGSASTASAQLNLSGLTSAPLAITLSPEHPDQYTAVTATVTGSGDLNAATISWFVDGKPLASGAGTKTARFEVGALGETVVIQAVAATARGELRATKEVTPAKVALIVEADGYAPPFYRGKTLNAEEATVRIVALPTFITSGGSMLAPGALTYTWTRNGQVLGLASGRGKNVLTLNNLYVTGQAQIGVEVQSGDETLAAGGLLDLATHEPLLLLYEDNPLLGIRFNRSLEESFALGDNEVTFVAIPYFFSIAKRNDPSLGYQWRVNGQAVVGDQENKSMITLRQGGEGGAADVGVAVARSESLFETLQKTVRVVFGGNQ